jgi:hypothetical protein
MSPEMGRVPGIVLVGARVSRPARGAVSDRTSAFMTLLLPLGRISVAATSPHEVREQIVAL